MARMSSGLTAVYALSLSLLVAPVVAHAEASATSKAVESGGIPLENLIEAVAKKTGKKFIVDPRVHAEVSVYGINAANISYPEFLTILELHRFSAVEVNGLTRIIPSVDARFMSVPTVSGSKHYADSEMVTKIIQPKSVSAVTLVLLLRPIVPLEAHLVAFACTNSLVIVDRYSNVQRLSALIEVLDKGEPFKPRDCSPEEVKK